MAMAMVRRRIAGYAKGKKKRAPVPRRSEPNEEMVGEQAVRMYSPMAAVGRTIAPKPWWHGIWKSLAIGSGVIVGCVLAFAVIKSPTRSYADTAAERRDYPRSAVLPHSRVVGAVEARRGETGVTGAKEDAGSREIVLSNRAAPTDMSFQATAYVRKKVYLPEISGNCVVGNGSQDMGECLRRQVGE